VRFRRGTRLDTGQISDRRGSGIGGMGPGVLLGGGGGGVVGIVLLVLFALGAFGEGGTGGGTGFELGDRGGGTSEDLAQECRTGADANQSRDCRIVAVVNSVQEFWGNELGGYEPATTVFFDGQVSTACGQASSAVGPFYCPADGQVYIDLGFYDDLEQRFGALGGPFAEAYVIAHEYGHHVQNLLGTSSRVPGGSQGRTSASVRLELQADCFAGVWAAHALETRQISELTNDDIADGLDAAAAVGDDRIQESATGDVDPHTWTHGSARQRQKWFTKGYRTGNREQCNTFAPDAL
jgi:predicted metalloprotease